MSQPQSIGERIIDEIAAQAMATVSYPDPEEAHVFVWSSSAVEQLEALIAEHAPHAERIAELERCEAACLRVTEFCAERGWSDLTTEKDFLAKVAEMEAELADWKRVAGELAKCLKEGQERIICSEHYPFDEAAKALAAFEAMEKATK